MIDNFALGVTHLIMMIAAVILLRRADLDCEPRHEKSADPEEPGSA
ncbi:MAG: hypothetical protein K2P68_00010 [Sphingomonas sp.]|nr:hypothetical protein [Sphingomonas sp.]